MVGVLLERDEALGDSAQGLVRRPCGCPAGVSRRPFPSSRTPMWFPGGGSATVRLGVLRTLRRLLAASPTLLVVENSTGRTRRLSLRCSTSDDVRRPGARGPAARHPRSRGGPGAARVGEAVTLAAVVVPGAHRRQRALRRSRRGGSRAVGGQPRARHGIQQRGAAADARGGPRRGAAAARPQPRLAVANDMREHAARAYTNLASALVRRRESAEACECSTPGSERDLDSWRYYMPSWKARALAQAGPPAAGACGGAGSAARAAPVGDHRIVASTPRPRRPCEEGSTRPACSTARGTPPSARARRSDSFRPRVLGRRQPGRRSHPPRDRG
jgi:hypothetical protein